VTEWRKLLAGALTASICLFGLAATVAAKPKPATKAVHNPQHPGDHPKLDRKLNDRAAGGGVQTSRVIVVMQPTCEASGDYAKLGVRRGRRLDLIKGDVVELPNYVLRKLADNPCVKDIHWDRPAGGKLNRAAVSLGARAIQQQLGYDGAGVGVAIIDSGITSWHDDLTYQGSNPAVKVVGGQRVVKFVDFVNGRLTPYDDNGHGSHVAGIIAGNGYDTKGARAGIAPAADLVSLKVLDDHGGGYISNVIAALDWVVTNHAAYNIRVINLSVGAAVTESYMTDPLTLAAKRVVDAGVVCVTAAGNLGRNNITGLPQYGAITAPGNAPWVLTVGADSDLGTVTRTDDIMAPYSSRGPTAIDYGAKPDVVAPGTGIVSLAVPGSTFYTTKAAYLLNGSIATSYKPYLSLTGTSMAAPMVAGTVALMMQANPKLTPNLAKAIIEYTAQDYKYNPLTQGAGFLNTKGAVDLARFYYTARAGQKVPSRPTWSKTVLWGNHKVTHGVIKPAGTAYAQNVVWGASQDAEGDNIVWGTECGADTECDNIVWGTDAMDADNIVWGTDAGEGDNIVWGTLCADTECDNIVWGTAAGEADNIVWGTECGGADCDNIVWGTNASELDNIVWGTDCSTIECDNIVWGTATGEVDNIVWGTASESDNVVWGTSGENSPVYDDPGEPSVFDGVDFDSLFTADPVYLDPTTTTTDTVTTTTATDTTTTTGVLGGGF
jgi:serine protease AprX